MSDTMRLTGTGDIVAQGSTSKRPCQVHSAFIEAGAGASVVVLRTNGAAGIIKLALSETTNAGSGWTSGSEGVLFADGIHATFAGAAAITVEYSAT